MRLAGAALLALALLIQPALRIVVIEGEGAVNIVQQKTAVAPIVEVRDQNNLPVAGAVVRFTIAGGKQAAFAGGSQTLTVTTNAAGRAAASGVSPLSSGTVQIQAAATFQGQTAVATITQTNVMSAAEAGASAASTSGATGGGGGLGGGAIAGIAGGVAAAGAAVVVSQRKDDESGTSGPPIDPAAQAASGTYTLQTVDGAGLPAVTVASPPASCAVITDSARLTLTASDREHQYEVIEISRTDCRLGPNTNFQSSSTGTWTISGTTITFTARADNYLLDAATLNAATLTMTVRPPHIDAGREAPRVTTVWRK